MTTVVTLADSSYIGTEETGSLFNPA